MRTITFAERPPFDEREKLTRILAEREPGLFRPPRFLPSSYRWYRRLCGGCWSQITHRDPAVLTGSVWIQGNLNDGEIMLAQETY